MTESPIRFGTLGTEGSNHSMVLRRYLAFRKIVNYEIVLVTRFEEAFLALWEDRLDFVLQVSVHPDHTTLSARYVNRVFPVDAFIAPSKNLAVITRRGIAEPRSIAFQPATKHYVNLDRWQEQIDEVSIMTVAEGLLEGRYDSGITAVDLANEHPDLFRVEERIGPVVDVWVVFGRDRLAAAPIVAWPDAPVLGYLRERQT